MIQTKVIANTEFTKIQGKVYVDIQGSKCQVKTKLSLNDVYIEIERFKNKTT